MAYAAMGLRAVFGVRNDAVLISLVGVGGLGIGFSALLRNLTTALLARFAPEVSGLINMTTLRHAESCSGSRRSRRP